MKKIFVNITSWTRIGSAGATHFYAKVSEIESDENIFVLARNGWITTDTFDLQKTLTKKGAKSLNLKDGEETYRAGNKTERFDSIEEIKATIKSMYPNNDIAFFNDRELISEDLDVIEINPTPIKKTGRKIRIHNFEGFSKEFINLTEGSIHDEIEMPEKYEDKELQSGAWVWGVTEPVLVLRKEFEYVK